MADPGFPDSHTTGGAAPRMMPSLRFDPSYIRTIPGILKAGQLVRRQYKINIFFSFHFIIKNNLCGFQRCEIKH